MKLAIVAVGKVRQSGMRQEIDGYLARVRHYAACDEVELKEPVDAARFERAIGPRARVVALEVDGKPLTSPQLAQLVGRAEDEAVGSLVFLIGGADGLPPQVSAAADLRISLSGLTLPHRLARLVLVEQLYRAFTILRSAPYHH